jgi:hypothetical protein
MIALASWAKEPAQVRLDIDWKAMGLNSRGLTITAPAIADFQPGASFGAGQPIPVEPGKGWILVVK